MPIHPEMKDLYPADWAELSRRIRFERAGGRCEECGAEQGQPHPQTGSKVILSTAHLDHNPANNAGTTWRRGARSATTATTRPNGIATGCVGRRTQQGN